MNTHKLFKDFNGKIKLVESKRQKLKSNRKALRDKIRKFFKEKEWQMPVFYSQGSFPLQTNLNPILKETEDGEIKEEYDLDDGVYFICSESDRAAPTTYHSRIIQAVGDHAESISNKNTCVRVVYADGHHIDLPTYWLKKDGKTPQLAHLSCGYTESDPKAFKYWVDKQINETNTTGQLRRIIRYLKAWKNYRESQNSSLKLLTGFIFTILVCNHYVEDDSDDVSIKKTVESIKNALDYNFACYRPTVPTAEDLLVSFNDNTILKELDNFIVKANNALDCECEKEASEYWRMLFGERFPLGESKDLSESVGQSNSSEPKRVKVSAPWSR
jgi:hypothetical protein